MKIGRYLNKSLRNTWLGLALLLVGFTPSLMQNAVAASSFVYNPVPYDTVVGPDFTANSPVFSPSGAFTTNFDLGMNQSWSLTATDFSFFSFSDGASVNPFTYTLANTIMDTFNVTLDGSGNIVSWLIVLTDNNVIINNALLLAKPPNANFGSQSAFHVSTDSNAITAESTGSWSIVSTTPAPALSSSLAGLLSVALLGGLLMRNRSKAVTRS